MLLKLDLYRMAQNEANPIVINELNKLEPLHHIQQFWTISFNKKWQMGYVQLLIILLPMQKS